MDNTKVKKFICGSKDVCYFKNHYINNRCFAPYAVRQSCPHILRDDGRTWEQGSVKEEVFTE